MHSTELAKCIRASGGYLRAVNLSKNRITDEGLNILAKAICESQLEKVDLSSNKITEKCIDSIVGTLKTNKVLKLLDLQNNNITSRVVKNKLKFALPSIDVLL